MRFAKRGEKFTAARAFSAKRRLLRWLPFADFVLFAVLTCAPLKLMSSTNQTETATLGGGCFWCTEAIFQMLPGVKSVVSGYAGGTKENPTYEEVCTGDTGHAEVIQIEYDPKEVSYSKILE